MGVVERGQTTRCVGVVKLVPGGHDTATRAGEFGKLEFGSVSKCVMPCGMRDAIENGRGGERWGRVGGEEKSEETRRTKGSDGVEVGADLGQGKEFH